MLRKREDRLLAGYSLGLTQLQNKEQTLWGLHPAPFARILLSYKVLPLQKLWTNSISISVSYSVLNPFPSKDCLLQEVISRLCLWNPYGMRR